MSYWDKLEPAFFSFNLLDSYAVLTIEFNGRAIIIVVTIIVVTIIVVTIIVVTIIVVTIIVVTIIMPAIIIKTKLSGRSQQVQKLAACIRFRRWFRIYFPLLNTCNQILWGRNKTQKIKTEMPNGLIL